MQMTPCTCGGENPRCFKCDGRGWLDPPQTANDGRLPPLRIAEKQTKRLSSSTSFFMGVEPSPLSAKAKQMLDESRKWNAANQFVSFTLTRREAEARGWLLPNARQSGDKVFVAKILRSELDCKKHHAHIRPVAIFAAPGKPKSKKQDNKPRTPKDPQQQLKSRTENRRNPKQETAIADAFVRAISEQETGQPDHKLDATREFWQIRDTGQFGSFPSHDDFDE